jgi:Ca2+-binding RTX toxin-like protein
MPTDIYKPTANDSLSLTELRLYKEIMAYRATAGLAEIPLSKALTTTAGRHAVDTYSNFWVPNVPYEPGANLHSWSDAPYYSDHSKAANMWDAPERLGTGFTGNGFEISAAGYGDVTAALAGWKASSGHNTVIMNLGIWANMDWKSIGIGVIAGDPLEDYQGRVYHVWFSDTADTGVPDIMGTAAANAFTGTSFRDRLFGMGGRDSIAGDTGADRIDGGAGRDRPTGDAGADHFVFSTRAGGADRIADFTHGSDDLWLARSAFAALGTAVTAGELQLGTAARDANDHLIYDRATGQLWYDADGKGGAAKVLFAVLEGDPALKAADFDMI